MNPQKTALITGATSGIGLAFARHFASIGYDLILTGRRKEIIGPAASEITKRYGVNAKVIIAELAKKSDVQKVVKAIADAENLDALVNNAGFGLNGMFYELKLKEHLDMLCVHVETPITLIHAALPGMIKRKRGIIINVSSLGAWTPAPINGIYGGTKSFLNIFTESLHMEVHPYGIKVQALCPGFTSTDFHKQMGIEGEMKKQRFLYWMKPEDVVKISMKYLEKDRVICIPGIPNKAIKALVAAIPRKLYYYAAGRSFRQSAQ